MIHRTDAVGQAPDSPKRLVQEASGMQPNSEPPPPRHRGDQPAVVFTSDPSDARRFPAIPGTRLGFRPNREVRSEMSPVIYRPAGSGEPERPARVSIAGPGVPTAASFADETPAPVEPESLDDDLDEDPEIDDDELAGEAADHLVDGGESAKPFLAERDVYGDDDSDDLADEVAPVTPVSRPTSQRRPPLQRRRRRLLGWASDPSTASEPVPEPEPEATRSPAEPPPVAPPPPVMVETHEVEPDQADAQESEIDEVDTEDRSPSPTKRIEELADESAEDEEQPDRALTRPRRVRTLHIAPPPVGPADEDLASTEDDPEVEVADDDAVVEPTPEPAPPTDESEAAAESEVETVDEPGDEAPVTAVADDPRWRQAAPTRFDIPAPQVEESQADEQPAANDEPAAALEDATAAQADAVAISGHVVSTRGRGLSGVSVIVVDADDQVVGTTITGRRGRYAVDGLSAGTSYRLGARDTIDGDFTDNWHGGDDAASATVLEPTEDGTVPDIDVTLTGRVAIDADVDVKRKKVRVEVEVIDRTTGLPGEGTVTISTDQFSTRLPLTDGRANITLLTPPEDRDPAERTDRRLRIEYPGSRHTGPATRTIRVH